MVLLTIAGSSLRAQASCADSNETTGQTMSYLVATVTSTDSADVAGRIALGIPAASQTDIVFVKDPVICARAGAAYAAAERDSTLTRGRRAQPGDSALGSTIQVFKVANRYVVFDESNRAGEFILVWVFDETFATPYKRLGL